MDEALLRAWPDIDYDAARTVSGHRIRDAAEALMLLGKLREIQVKILEIEQWDLSDIWGGAVGKPELILASERHARIYLWYYLNDFNGPNRVPEEKLQSRVQMYLMNIFRHQTEENRDATVRQAISAIRKARDRSGKAFEAHRIRVVEKVMRDCAAKVGGWPPFEKWNKEVETAAEYFERIFGSIQKDFRPTGPEVKEWDYDFYRALSSAASHPIADGKVAKTEVEKAKTLADLLPGVAKRGRPSKAKSS